MLSCQAGENSISIELKDYAFNQIPLPNEYTSLGKLMQKDFELKPNETHCYQDINIKDLMKGKLKPSFPYYPISIKKGEISIHDSKFQIGLIDENRNGSYQDVDVDKVIFIPKDTDSIYYSSTYAPVTTLRADTYAKINEQAYRIESGQDKIILHKLTSPPDTFNCIFNSNIPNIAVVNEQGATMNLQDFKERDKNMIVELWFNGCRGCVRTLPELKKIDTSKNTIVSFNVVDALHTINGFKERHDIQWDMIKADKADLKTIGNLGNYPSAVVYDKNGDLIDLNKSYLRPNKN